MQPHCDSYGTGWSKEDIAEIVQAQKDRYSIDSKDRDNKDSVSPECILTVKDERLSV